MKLNQDCVRDLLLTLEEEFNLNDSADVAKLHEMPRLNQYHQDEVTYVILKCEEAGFINAQIANSFDGYDALVTGLSYDGHQFLENIRNDKVWEETKAKAKQIGTASLPVLANVASSYIKNSLGL